jgi:DNA-binding response OmpR family regulator
MKLKKILIIDDEEDVSRLLSVRLRSKGFATTTYSDGLTAVEAVRRTQPDLLILDIHLPGITGFEICKTLRQSQEFATLPVLFFSADVAQKEDCLHEVGAQGFIKKPYDAADVLNLIQSIFAETHDFAVFA